MTVAAAHVHAHNNPGNGERVKKKYVHDPDSKLTEFSGFQKDFYQSLSVLLNQLHEPFRKSVVASLFTII